MPGDIGSRIIMTFGYVITHQADQLIKPFLRHTNEISLSKFVILTQDLLFLFNYFVFTTATTPSQNNQRDSQKMMLIKPC